MRPGVLPLAIVAGIALAGLLVAETATADPVEVLTLTERGDRGAAPQVKGLTLRQLARVRYRRKVWIA